MNVMVKAWADSLTWSGRNTIRNMVNKGLPDAWRHGPILSQAQYPDVIVARAVTDGSALNLVLHPGAEGGLVTLGLGRLTPGRRYAIRQTDKRFTATEAGSYEHQFVLKGRTPLDIVPLA